MTPEVLAHPWFDWWTKAPSILVCVDPATRRHLHVSLRAMVSMRVAPDQAGFTAMLGRRDAPCPVRLLSHCPPARVPVVLLATSPRY